MVYLHETGFSFGKYGRTYHLFADTVEELHEFADRIGLKREWFQHSGKTLPHYDVFGSKYEKAVENGAELVGWKKTHEMIIKYRRYD